MSLDVRHITERLNKSAAVFASLTDGIQDVQARWKPAPDKWSILEVVNHLADEEELDFGTRLRLLLEEPGREWPPIDPPRWAIEGEYNKRQLGESMQRFLASRRKSVEWLRGLQQPDWERQNQGNVGPPLRAGDLLYSWLEHDLIHIRQINRLHHEYAKAVCEGFSSDYAGDW